MENVFNSFIDLGKAFETIMPLQAIWLEKPVRTANGTTVRIEKGNKIRVKDGLIKDISEENPATHEVIKCEGNIKNSVLILQLKDLQTNQISNLNVQSNEITVR